MFMIAPKAGMGIIASPFSAARPTPSGQEDQFARIALGSEIGLGLCNLL